MKKDPMWRLTADEGKLVTNGTIKGKVIDVAPNLNPDDFYEIDEEIDENKEVEQNG